MIVVDNNKERKKLILCNDIENLITNLNAICIKERDTISIIDNTLNGSSTGVERELISSVNATLKELSTVHDLFKACKERAHHIDTTEEIPDEQYK